MHDHKYGGNGFWLHTYSYTVASWHTACIYRVTICRDFWGLADFSKIFVINFWAYALGHHVIVYCLMYWLYVVSYTAC